MGVSVPTETHTKHCNTIVQSVVPPAMLGKAYRGFGKIGN